MMQPIDVPILTNEECNHLINIGYSQTLNYSLNGSNGEKNLTLFNSKMNYIIPNIFIADLYQKIKQTIFAINEYVWKFDLYDLGEPLRFIEYNDLEKSSTTIHYDIGDQGSALFRKLTIVIQLTNDNQYEGGDLIVYNPGEVKMTRKRGTMIVFPSFMLHKVEEVTKGIRNSAVTHLFGPPFK